MIISIHNHKRYHLMTDMKDYGVYMFATNVYFILPT